MAAVKPAATADHGRSVKRRSPTSSWRRPPVRYTVGRPSMKALLKEAAGPGLTLTEVPEPEPGPKEVLVRVVKAAVCGTDLHIYHWDEWARSVVEPPLVLGHEFVGEVVALGTGATLHRVGDRVSGEGHITCGLCRNCRAGKPHLCHLTRGVGVHRDGAFAELVVMPESNLWPIHGSIPTEIAAFLDPAGQRHALRPVVRPGGRGRADHRRRADRG